MIVIFIGFLFTYLQNRAKIITGNVKENDSGGIKNPNRPDYGIGGDWELTNTKGQIMTQKDLKGSYYVMYFGFAKCPDICPNFLIRMSKAMKILRNSPESQFFKLKVLFVSVDPDRDSPEDLDRFLGLFDRSIIGLSGVANSDIRLINCMKQFKVYANKIYRMKEAEGTKDYMVDHTSLGYLMDHNNELVMIIGPNLSGDQIAKAIVDDSIFTNDIETKAIRNI